MQKDHSPHFLIRWMMMMVFYHVLQLFVAFWCTSVKLVKDQRRTEMKILITFSKCSSQFVNLKKLYSLNVTVFWENFCQNKTCCALSPAFFVDVLLLSVCHLVRAGVGDVPLGLEWGRCGFENINFGCLPPWEHELCPKHDPQ